MDAFYFIEANALAIFLGCWLAVMVKKEGTLRASNKIFFATVICTTVMLALEAACAVADGRAENSFYIANIILNAVRLTVSVFTAQKWLFYTLHFLRPKQTLPKWVNRVIPIPTVILTVLILASPFTGWIFSVGKYTNLYTHGKYYFAYIIATYTYFLGASLYALVKTFKRGWRPDRMSGTYIIVFVLLPAACGTITLVLPYIHVAWILCEVSLFILFTRVQFGQIVQDALTGVKNRNYFDNYFFSISSEKVFSACLFMIDINFFKKINDTHGHPEGDQALEQTAKIISRIFTDEDCVIARYGGDEFAVLTVLEEQTPETKSDAENKRLALYEAFAEYNKTSGKPYELTVSAGYSIITGRGEPSAVQLIKTSDADLYREKQRFHRTRY